MANKYLIDRNGCAATSAEFVAGCDDDDDDDDRGSIKINFTPV
jgi:hypothetical protein